VTETPPLPSVSPLRSKWKIRTTILTFLLVGALMLEGRVALVMEPRYERMFVEMLGGFHLLPKVTSLMVEVSRFVQINVLWLLPLLLLPLILLWWKRGATWVCVLSGTLSLALVGLAVTTYLTMVLAATQIIRDMGSPASPELEEFYKELRVRPEEN
jgi:hypothetical protein